jgi:hypothetical protein
MGVAVVAAIAVVPQTTSAQSGADLTLVHGIPGTTVDVSVDGTVVIDAFVPGSLANISSFAGQTLQNVTVTDDATGDVVIGPLATLEVPDSGSFSVVAYLDEDGTPVLGTFENNTDPTDNEGEARLTLRHTAEAGPVDLVIGDQRPLTDLSNGQSGELELPDGDLTGAELAPTGGIAIADLPTLDLAANTNTIVYGVGSADDDTIDFIVQVVDFTIEVPASTSSTTSTSGVPTAVNTGSPIGGTSSLVLIIVALGGLTLAGGAMVARRRT